MAVIHPSHVAVVNEVFRPSADELAWARRVRAALDAAAGDGRGAVTLDGAMVDLAMAATADSLLADALLAEEPEETRP
jgi:citrate lyase subunit beta/citryl-CoA lyase